MSTWRRWICRLRGHKFRASTPAEVARWGTILAICCRHCEGWYRKKRGAIGEYEEVTNA